MNIGDTLTNYPEPRCVLYCETLYLVYALFFLSKNSLIYYRAKTS